MLCRTPGTCPTIASVYPSKLQRTTTRTLDVRTSLTLVSVQYFLFFLVPKHGTQKGQNIDKRNLLDEFVNWSFFSWLLIIYQQTLETSTSVPSPPATRFFALIICLFCINSIFVHNWSSLMLQVLLKNATRTDQGLSCSTPRCNSLILSINNKDTSNWLENVMKISHFNQTNIAPSIHIMKEDKSQ